MFTEECINTFLENQEQLFPQAVAESYEAAEAFLEDCMAQVVDSIEEVREYLESQALMWKECQMKNWKMQVKYLLCRMENI